MQMFTELKRPPMGSVVLVTPLPVDAGVAGTDGLLVSLVAGFGAAAAAAANRPNGAAGVELVDVTAVTEVVGASGFGAGTDPPKPSDDPRPPKLKAEELEVPPPPTAPPVPLKPPKSKDFVSAFEVAAAAFAGSGAGGSFGLAGSDAGGCSIPKPAERFVLDTGVTSSVAAAAAVGAVPPPPKESGVFAPPPKLKLEPKPPKMDEPGGLAASPAVKVFVVVVTVEVLAKGLLWLKAKVVALGLGAIVCMPGFSTTAGLDGIGLGS